MKIVEWAINKFKPDAKETTFKPVVPPDDVRYITTEYTREVLEREDISVGIATKSTIGSVLLGLSGINKVVLIEDTYMKTVEVLIGCEYENLIVHPTLVAETLWKVKPIVVLFTGDVSVRIKDYFGEDTVVNFSYL